MKKKFKYKLDAALKVRKFKEMNLKIALSQILNEIYAAEDKIKKLSLDIDVLYRSQEDLLENDGASANFIQSFPVYLNAKNADIKNTELILKSLREKYDLKLTETKAAMGDVKLIENLKEKAFTLHHKENMKQDQQNLEEMFAIRKNYLK